MIGKSIKLATTVLGLLLIVLVLAIVFELLFGRGELAADIFEIGIWIFGAYVFGRYGHVIQCWYVLRQSKWHNSKWAAVVRKRRLLVKRPYDEAFRFATQALKSVPGSVKIAWKRRRSGDIAAQKIHDDTVTTEVVRICLRTKTANVTEIEVTSRPVTSVAAVDHPQNRVNVDKIAEFLATHATVEELPA